MSQEKPAILPVESSEKISRPNPAKIALITSLALSLTLNHGLSERETRENSPLSPSPTLIAADPAIESSRDIYLRSTGQDHCPPPPDPADTEHYFTTDYEWPKSAKSYQEIAESLDLTLADFDSFLQTQETIQNATSHQTVIDALSEFSREQYGVETKFVGFDQHPESIPHLNNFIGKGSSYNRTLFLMPKELIKATGLETIEIRPLFRETGTDIGRAIGSYSGDHLTIQLDIDHVSDESVFIHELVGHGIHYTFCEGRVREDDAISDHNPEGVDQYRMNNETLSELNHFDDGDGVYDESTFVTHYAEFGVQEDVAELTSAIVLGELELNEDLQNTPTGKKAAVVMHRLDEAVPNVVEFLRTVYRL